VFKGSVGDPWIPINSETGVALNVGATGFTYDRTRQLLLEDGFEGSPCQQIQPEDAKAEQLWLCCAALARGQGGTEGFHERWVPIQGKARSFLLNPDKKRTLGELSRERVTRAGNVWDKALFPALQALLSGGGKAGVDEKKKKSKPHKMPERWKWTYEQGINQCYFQQLWEDLESEVPEQQRRWAEVLRDLARTILHQAEREAPVPDARRERASAAAWGLLEAGMRKQIPEAFADHTPTRDVEEDLDADPTLP
jgi:CRISPR system Cascade subunit CasA